MTRENRKSAVLQHIDRLGRTMSTCTLILMILLSLLIFYDALMRAAGHPTIWVFESSLYSFIFIGFLGNALAVKRRAHFRVTFLMEVFPRSRKALNLISDTSLLLFGLLLISSGIYFTHYLWSNSVASSSLLEVPMWIPSLAIPLGGLGLVTQTIVSMLGGDAIDASPTIE